jgi:hypothetical protein
MVTYTYYYVNIPTTEWAKGYQLQIKKCAQWRLCCPSVLNYSAYGVAFPPLYCFLNDEISSLPYSALLYGRLDISTVEILL